MQEPACGLPRILLLRTSVNRGSVKNVPRTFHVRLVVLMSGACAGKRRGRRAPVAEPRGARGRQVLPRSERGVPRWPAAGALLLIGASYIALSEDVTVGPRAWLPGLMTVLVVPLMSAHARGHYRLARVISFVLLGVATASVGLSVVLLVTTLPGRGASALSVLVDAALIWISNVVTFAVWYWEIDGGGPTERTTDAHASEDYLFPQMAQQKGREATGWAPGFLDYLFLAFNTSAAFSPTDTPVLSRRAKLLTMVQSLLSLVVVLVLVGWAINTLSRPVAR
jgi:uncharacterized membrane protein